MIISETVKSGVVVRTRGNSAWVKISCGDDHCNSCRIASLCSTPAYTPTLRARIESGLEVKSGDKVMLMGRVKGWLKGWLLLAGLPCLAILVGLVLGSMFVMKDGAVGIISLGLVMIYYVLLWRFRSKIDRNVEWIIESLRTD